MVLEVQHPRRTGWWVALALLALGSAAIAAWLPRAGPTILPATVTALAVGDGAPARWRALCVAGPYELADTPIEQQEGVTCRLRDEVPAGRSLLVYVGPGERCTALLLPAPAIAQDAFDTRCFARREVEGRELRLEDGVFKLRDGDHRN